MASVQARAAFCAVALPRPCTALEFQAHAADSGGLSIVAAALQQAIGDLPCQACLGFRVPGLAARQPEAGRARCGLRQITLPGEVQGIPLRGTTHDRRRRLEVLLRRAEGALRMEDEAHAVVASAEFPLPVHVGRILGGEVAGNREGPLDVRGGIRHPAQRLEQGSRPGCGSRRGTGATVPCPAPGAPGLPGAPVPHGGGTASPPARPSPAGRRRSRCSTMRRPCAARVVGLLLEQRGARCRAQHGTARARRRGRPALRAPSRCCCWRTPARAASRRWPASMPTRRSASPEVLAEVHERGVETALPPVHEPHPEVALRQIVQPLAVVRVPVRERLGEGERLRKRLPRFGEPSLGDAHVADLVQRRRALRQFLVAQRRLGNGGEVVQGLRTDIIQNLEPADLLQLLPQVAEHEADQVFRLLAPPFRVAARRDGDRAFSPQVDDVLRRAERRQLRCAAAISRRRARRRGLGGDPAQPVERVDGRRPLGGRERLQALDEACQVGVEAGGRRNVSSPGAIEQRRVVVRLRVRAAGP